MGLFADHPDTVECYDWAEPLVPLAQKHRIEQDGAGLRMAARDIVRDGLAFASRVLTAPDTDPRLVPFLRDAINWQRRQPVREEN